MRDKAQTQLRYKVWEQNGYKEWEYFRHREHVKHNMPDIRQKQTLSDINSEGITCTGNWNNYLVTTV